MTAESMQLVQLWAHYRNGRLLREGGLDAQPHRYLQAMDLLTAFAESGVSDA